MYTLPQGCLAKREIISDERKYVQNFLVQQFQTIFPGAAGGEVMKNLGIYRERQRRRPRPEVVRAAPMLKNE
jgi:hypothetical protein